MKPLEEIYQVPQGEPDYCLVKVPIQCIYNGNFKIKELCNRKLYDCDSRTVSPTKVSIPHTSTLVLESGYLVQRKSLKLDKIVSLKNKKVLIRNGFKAQDRDKLKPLEFVLHKSVLQRQFNFKLGLGCRCEYGNSDTQINEECKCECESGSD